MSLQDVRDRLARAAVILDYDGTLAPIVSHPQDALPLPGVTQALAALLPRVHRLAIVTGRPAAFVRERLPVEGLEIVGLYGMDGAPPIDRLTYDAVAAVVATEPGATLEDKGVTLAAHVRNAPDPDAAETRLRELLVPIAEAAGLVLREGKRVLELTPRGGGKGAVVRHLARDAEAVLVAGDDLADLESFRALEDLDAVVCRVAVLGLEAPDELRLGADVTVEGPEGLLVLLRSLELHAAGEIEVP